MKLKKVPLLLLPLLSLPSYADEAIQLDDMTITAPPATSNLVLEGEKLAAYKKEVTKDEIDK